MSIRSRRSQLSDERGFTLITAILMLVMLVLITGVVATQSISARGGATRSTKSAQAVQAADAAVNVAVERLTELKIDQGAAQPCSGVDANSKLTVQAYQVSGAWCPAVNVTVPGASAYYYVGAPTTTNNNNSATGCTSNTNTTYNREIVGVATVGSGTNGVTRRVRTRSSMTKSDCTKTTGSTTPLFQGFAVLSKGDLTLTNGYYVTGGGVRSDGNITLNTTSPPTTNHCHVPDGPVTPGVGKTVFIQNNATTCGQSTAPATSALSMTPTSLPTTFDNTTTGKVPTVTGSASWDKDNKSLNVQNSGDTATLKGNTYVFCSLTMSGGTLNISPTDGKAVAIYFPAPGSGSSTSTNTSCPSSTLNIFNGAVVNRGNASLGAAGLQFYASGSSTLTFNNNSVVNATVWAPLGTVQIQNQGGVQGAVAGNSVTLGGNAPGVIYDSTASSISGAGGTSTSTSTSYNSLPQESGSYRECPSTVPAATAPSANC